MIVYLAGGMSPTQARLELLAALQGKGITVLDPSTHGLSREDEYTDWDCAAIDRADTVVAFMEHCNPSGFGLNFEVGYARARGKPVVFLSLWSDDFRNRYFGMVRASSLIVRSIEECVKTLA